MDGKRTVVVHVGQLALRGLQGAEARAVVEALRSELGARLVHAAGSGNGAPLPLRIGAGTSPAQLGSAAAGAVASAIGGHAALRGVAP